MVQYSFLKESPQYIDLLGAEIYREWDSMYKFQGKTEAEVIDTVRSRAVTDRIPLTMIAHENGTLLGSVTLKTSEGDDFPELSPWLAGVFVLPSYRGRNIGWNLVDFAEQVARDNFGVKKLFLYTSTAENLYLRKGYRCFSEKMKDGKIVKYMEKDL